MFKTIFYCDKCGDVSTKYAEWNIIFDIQEDYHKDKKDKMDLCSKCHKMVFNHLQRFKGEVFVSNINPTWTVSTASDSNKTYFISSPTYTTATAKEIKQRDENQKVLSKALDENIKRNKKRRTTKKK